jgi:hypothetical protein
MAAHSFTVIMNRRCTSATDTVTTTGVLLGRGTVRYQAGERGVLCRAVHSAFVSITIASESIQHKSAPVVFT